MEKLAPIINESSWSEHTSVTITQIKKQSITKTQKPHMILSFHFALPPRQKKLISILTSKTIVLPVLNII